MAAATQPKSTPSVGTAPQPITPHLIVDGAKDAIAFYERAFGVKAEIAAQMPDGRLLHGSLQFPNGGVVYLMDSREPRASGPSPVVIHLEVPDVDAAFKRAVDAGAKVEMELADQFWGDRYGSVVDPFGHVWSMSTHVRDVSPEELQKATQNF